MHSRSAEQVLAFLRWWGDSAPPPSIPGMQFSSTHKSQFAKAVMDKASPGHKLTAQSRSGSWGRHLAFVKSAALSVLRKLEKQRQLGSQ